MFTTIAAAVLGFFIRRPGMALIIVAAVLGAIGLAWGGGKVTRWWHQHQQEKVLKMDREAIKQIEEARNDAAKASQTAKQAIAETQAARRELATLAHQMADLRARANKMEPQLAALKKSRQDIDTAFKAQQPPKDLQEAHSALEALGYGRR